MTHRLATNYAKNYCNRTLIVKVIVENVVTCFFGTRCSCSLSANYTIKHHRSVLQSLTIFLFLFLFSCRLVSFLLTYSCPTFLWFGTCDISADGFA